MEQLERVEGCVFGSVFESVGMSKEEAMQKYIDCIESQKVKYA